MSDKDTDYIITTGVTDAKGNTQFTTKTPTKKEKKATPKEKRAEMLAKMGVYNEFLKEHPDIADLIRRAIKDYKNGDEWTDQKFQMEYVKTDFAKDRSKAEEEFDIGMGGPNADTYNKKVEDYTKTLMQNAMRLGVDLSPEEAAAQARAAVRSDLKQTDMDAYWQTQYLALTEGGDATMPGGKAVTGTAAQIQDQLKQAAMNFGVKLDDAMLREKTGMALGQGERWQEWVQGQEGFFRDQAKLLFPNAAHLFDQGKTLRDIAEPYFSEAADMLGLSAEQMSLTDPKWTGFLNGADGKILSRDEWMRVLRTDPQYGWDKSTKARQSFAGIGDELLSAFGMA